MRFLTALHRRSWKQRLPNPDLSGSRDYGTRRTVDAVSDRTASAQLERAPTKQEE